MHIFPFVIIPCSDNVLFSKQTLSSYFIAVPVLLVFSRIPQKNHDDTQDRKDESTHIWCCFNSSICLYATLLFIWQTRILCYKC
jgi:hypothetical protein